MDENEMDGLCERNKLSGSHHGGYYPGTLSSTHVSAVQMKIGHLEMKSMCAQSSYALLRLDLKS